MDKKTYYDEYFKRVTPAHGEVSTKDQLIVDCLKKRKPVVGNLLDIGCLNSPLPEAIRDSVEVAKYYGIDLIPEAESGAIERGIIYAQADVDEGIPFGDVKFDVIVCSEVLEHLFCPDNVFAFAGNNLAKNGLLMVTTPNMAAWFNRIALLFGYQPAFTEVSTKYNVGKIWTHSTVEVGGHLRVFTSRALLALADCYGLKPVYRASTGGGPGIVGVLNNLLSIIPSMGTHLVCGFARSGDE